MTVCGCCNHEPAVGVAAIPGVAMSIPWCVPCLQAGVLPVSVAVTQVALCDGPEQMDEGYLDAFIAPTLFYFNIDIDEFLFDVRELAALLDLDPDT